MSRADLESARGLPLGVRRAGLVKAERGADTERAAPRSGAALI